MAFFSVPSYRLKGLVLVYDSPYLYFKAEVENCKKSMSGTLQNLLEKFRRLFVKGNMPQVISDIMLQYFGA